MFGAAVLGTFGGMRRLFEHPRAVLERWRSQAACGPSRAFNRRAHRPFVTSPLAGQQRVMRQRFRWTRICRKLRAGSKPRTGPNKRHTQYSAKPRPSKPQTPKPRVFLRKYTTITLVSIQARYPMVRNYTQVCFWFPASFPGDDFQFLNPPLRPSPPPSIRRAAWVAAGDAAVRQGRGCGRGGRPGPVTGLGSGGHTAREETREATSQQLPDSPLTSTIRLLLKEEGMG